MSIMNTRKTGTVKKTATSKKRTLTRSKAKRQIPYLREESVPAGSYVATIVSVTETKTATTGNDAIEIVYELCDPNGRIVQVKEKLVINSYYYRELIDHLFDIDLLQDGADLDDMVGIREEVTVEYSDESGFGRFTSRQPCQQKVSIPHKTKKQVLLSADSDDDDDEEDFLEDEEE